MVKLGLNINLLHARLKKLAGQSRPLTLSIFIWRWLLFSVNGPFLTFRIANVPFLTFRIVTVIYRNGDGVAIAAAVVFVTDSEMILQKIIDHLNTKQIIKKMASKN
jgi:hypothetical protein